MAQVVRLLSQRWVHHRGSPLSVTGAPAGHGPRAGDRLPDEVVNPGGGSARLHQLIATPGVHVLLQRRAQAFDREIASPYVAMHRIASWPGRGVVAVRPDGHVGYRCGEADRAQLLQWVRLVGASP